MKSKFLFILFAITIISCGKEEGPGSTDPNNGNNGNQTISQADLDNISGPCADEAATIQLPNELTIPSNYTRFEQTIEIFSVVELSKSLLTAFDTPILPPPSAIYAEVDDIVVFVGDNAYEWKVDQDKYLFTLNDDGYTMKFFKNGEGFLGTNFVSLVQSEDCSSFEYLQYANEDEGDQKIGDLVFKYNYQESGSSKIIKMGTDLYHDQSEEYEIRSFDDLSGDLYVRQGGETVRYMNWNTDGSGIYRNTEDGIETESGTWSF